jgi:hypothetical protein
VTGHSLVEAEATEQSERGREILLSVESFLFDRPLALR